MLQSSGWMGLRIEVFIREARMFFRKKEERQELFGAFGKSIDYHFYHMSLMEKVTGYLLGTVIGFVGTYIFFDMIFLSVPAGILAGFAGIRIWCKMLKKKRARALTLQFKDMLESLSTSIGAGKNTANALEDAKKDMENQYGIYSYIVMELYTMIEGIRNGIQIEDLLLDFGVRSENEDIMNFADVFATANRQGGNMQDILYETKNIISQKIDIEMEIQTMVSGSKNELNIMMVMPFIIVTITKGFTSTGGFSLTNFLVKLLALAMFIGAYFLGQKMTDIRV